jgi:hypothetical protein
MQGGGAAVQRHYECSEGKAGGGAVGYQGKGRHQGDKGCSSPGATPFQPATIRYDTSTVPGTMVPVRGRHAASCVYGAQQRRALFMAFLFLVLHYLIAIDCCNSLSSLVRGTIGAVSQAQQFARLRGKFCKKTSLGMRATPSLRMWIVW